MIPSQVAKKKLTYNQLRQTIHKLLIQENKEVEILKIRDFRVWYPIKKGIFKKTVDYVKAIDAINFSLKRKETLGIVGESGSGKTSLVLAILKLITSSGTIKFEELD